MEYDNRDLFGLPIGPEEPDRGPVMLGVLLVGVSAGMAMYAIHWIIVLLRSWIYP